MNNYSFKAEQYFNEGLEYLDNSDYENAEKSYLTAIRMQRDYVEPNIGLGLLYIQMQDYRKAISFLEKAKLVLGKDANIFGVLGCAYILNGEEQKAIAIWKRAVDINHDYLVSVTILIISTLEPLERFDDCDCILKGIIKCVPNNPDLYGLYANIKLNQEQFDEAESIVAKIFEIDSNNAFGYEILGSSAIMKEDYEVAMQHYQKLNELFPEKLLPIANIARIYSLTGNAKDAIKMMNIILKNDEIDLDARFICANCYCDLDKPKEAIKILKNILTIDPDYSEATNLFLELVTEVRDMKNLNWLNNNVLIKQGFDLNDLRNEIQVIMKEIEMEERED